jgi:RimJ/RimL family protein N-acetyltransferase
MIDALIKRAFENENYHRFIISLPANNLTSFSPYATDLTSDM